MQRSLQAFLFGRIIFTLRQRGATASWWLLWSPTLISGGCFHLARPPKAENDRWLDTRENSCRCGGKKKKKKCGKKKRRGRVESFFSGHPETGQLAATGGGTTFSSIFPLCYRIGDNDCSTRRQIRAICWKKISHRPLSPVTEASNSPGGSTQTFRRVLTFLCAISPPLRIQSQAAHAAD